MSDEQQTQATDDPSGDGWRDVLPGEILQPDDMSQRHLGWATFPRHHGWQKTRYAGTPAPRYLQYRRRIEPQIQKEDGK